MHHNIHCEVTIRNYNIFKVHILISLEQDNPEFLPYSAVHSEVTKKNYDLTVMAYWDANCVTTILNNVLIGVHLKLPVVMSKHEY